MKPREPRRKVMIKARMRIGATWNDVCILNISSRGLSMQAAAPPPRGTYFEVRRGEYVITACVMWVNHHRFGVRTQDVLPIDQIVNQPDRSAPAPAGAAFPERRQAQRATRHEDSRILARTMEFAVLGVFAASVALATFGTLTDVLRPLSELSAALAPK